jgi:glucokinase
MPGQTIEAIASGWSIAAATQRYLNGTEGPMPGHSRDELDELLRLCGGDAERLTAKDVACAAAQGNRLALDVLSRAWQALGWGIAQVITLVAPAVIVIGGGVSQMGEELLFSPLRAAVKRYVFEPFVGTFAIVPAALGEEMVVYGALALAAARVPSEIDG